MAGSKKIVHAKVLWPTSHVQFNAWQKKQHKSLSPNVSYVSSAEEYHRATVEDFCPVCQVDHSIEFLGAITQAWGKFGGPFRKDPEPRTAHPDYGCLKLAWRAARLELLNLVNKLESQAVIENRLDSYIPPATHDNGRVTTVHGAQAALERFHRHYKYPVSDVPHNGEEEELLYCSPLSSLKKNRKVHFADQLVEGGVRKNLT
ncbi:uncharacterized protein N0V89_008360 [Didymosphaeria variabile]|uniref:Uncharacterized protein n=1 Tax=Didymosphaeria variabile TaxID=1932322 RepID=A0A9W8XHE6_9PLEO|nr:uncharacterized protein N0V89_008360 [Didymosphaeria variabile]KAJ4349742.1 hypothetical protein N0V89_008360 [Didymosphaeria variabile]